MAAAPTRDFVHAQTGLVVRVEPDEDGGYFALVPALPGCGSQGETVRETLAHLGDALSAVLDLMQREQPERFAALLGSRTSAGAKGSERTSSRTPVTIVDPR